MNLILSIERKNRCLERFLKLTLDKCVELKNQDDLLDPKTLDLFVSHREALLKLVQYQDKRITEQVQEIGKSDRTPELIEKVQRLMEETDQCVSKIQKADEEFFNLMKMLGDKLQMEIAKAKKTSGTLSRFKATGENAANRLDKRL